MDLLISEQRLMGASLLVIANKTDVSGCMIDDEIRQVEKDPLPFTVRSTIDTSRSCNSMQYRRISGPSSDAVQSRGSICRKDWLGWYRMRKTGCSCTEGAESRGIV